MTDPLREELVETRADRLSEAVRPEYDFAAVVAQYETPLLRYAAQILGKGAAGGAEDVVQEAFLRLHRQVLRHGEGSVRNLSSWIYRVAHNLAMDQIRKQQREKRGKERARQQGVIPSTEPEDEVDALGEMMHREACDKALEELHNLPESQKHVLLLKIIQGMTFREIGEVTGLTPGNAAYRIDCGLRALAKKLKTSGVI